MAKLYGEIAAKALLTLDKSFARANGQPLDASEVYYSLDAAKAYAATAQAYIGQKIVVIEDGVVTHYSVDDTAGNLKELGSKPVADGTTVAIGEDGKITLANITEAEASGTYNAVLVNGKLTWVKPSSTTVEGLNDLITALTGRVDTAESEIDALQAAVGVAAKPESSEGAGDAVAATGLFKAIADEIARATAAEEALGGRIDAIDFVDEDELTDAIKDFATKTYVGEEIAKIEVPVAGISAEDKILALGADKLISATVALTYDSDNKKIKLTGKDGADLGSVDATPFIKDGMLNDVNYNADNNTLTFTWNVVTGEDENGDPIYQNDEVILSDIIEPYTAGAGLKLEGNEFAVKVAEGNESFLTVDENGVKLSGVQTAIDTAKAGAISDAEGKIATAKQEAIDAAAGDATTKANTAEQNAKDYADGKFATKEYVGTIPNDDEGNPKAANVVAYIEAKAAEVLSQATGGSSESAASVKGQLDTFKAEINPKVTKNTEDISTINEKLKDIEANADVNIIESIKVNGNALTPDENKAVDITIPTKFSDITDDSGFDARITAAQTQADKGVNDASAAQTTANEAKGAAETNASAIGSLNTTVAGHTTTIGEHTTKIADLETFQTEHTALYNSLKSTVDGHVTAIAGKAEQTALDAAVADIAKNTSAIQTLNETTIPGINGEIAKKADADKVYSKTAMDAIIGTPTEGKTIVEMIEAAQTAATYDDTQVKADIKANTDAIAKLNGDDKTEGSVDYKVAQEVAKILNDNDASDIDTLNEIAAWITNDTTGAAKMNADIAANTAAITKLNGNAETEGSVLSMIAANAPKTATNSLLGVVMGSAAENKISIAEDGTMEVNTLNVNKLVQTDGEFLILNGGSANA